MLHIPEFRSPLLCFEVLKIYVIIDFCFWIMNSGLRYFGFFQIRKLFFPIPSHYTWNKWFCLLKISLHASTLLRHWWNLINIKVKGSCWFVTFRPKTPFSTNSLAKVEPNILPIDWYHKKIGESKQKFCVTNFLSLYQFHLWKPSS